jgi:hypothetical protein
VATVQGDNGAGVGIQAISQVMAKQMMAMQVCLCLCTCAVYGVRVCVCVWKCTCAWKCMCASVCAGKIMKHRKYDGGSLTHQVIGESDLRLCYLLVQVGVRLRDEWKASAQARIQQHAQAPHVHGATKVLSAKPTQKTGGGNTPQAMSWLATSWRGVNKRVCNGTHFRMTISGAMYDGVPQKILSFLLGSRHITEKPKSTSFMSPSLVNKMFSSCPPWQAIGQTISSTERFAAHTVTNDGEAETDTG